MKTSKHKLRVFDKKKLSVPIILRLIKYLTYLYNHNGIKFD